MKSEELRDLESVREALRIVAFSEGWDFTRVPSLSALKKESILDLPPFIIELAERYWGYVHAAIVKEQRRLEMLESTIEGLKQLRAGLPDGQPHMAAALDTILAEYGENL